MTKKLLLILLLYFLFVVICEAAEYRTGSVEGGNSFRGLSTYLELQREEQQKQQQHEWELQKMQYQNQLEMELLRQKSYLEQERLKEKKLAEDERIRQEYAKSQAERVQRENEFLVRRAFDVAVKQNLIRRQIIFWIIFLLAVLSIISFIFYFKIIPRRK